MTKLQSKEILLCARDFDYFQRTYLQLPDKRAKVVRMHRLPVQDEIREHGRKDRFRFYLKARRLGCSAEIAGEFFHAAMFHMLGCIVVSHRKPSAQEIYEQYYEGFYKRLPSWLRNIFRLEKSNRRELRFVHGGRVVVTTSESEEARSGGFQLYHLSEASRYKHLEVTLAAILTSAPLSARIVIETTANGPNELFDFWHQRGQWEMSRRYAKHFLNWMSDPGYAGVRVKDGVYRVDAGIDAESGKQIWESVDFNEHPLDERELAYRRDHDISMERMSFVRMALSVLCGGNWNVFNQEFPATADLAFILGGTPYFTRRYIEVASGENKTGLNVIAKPQRFRTYVLGSDPGPGASGGAWSTGVVLDVTHEKKVTVAATLGTEGVGAISFAERLFALGMQYNALINPERNNIGVAVIEQLLRMKYPWWYWQRVLNKKSGDYGKRLGYDTQEASRLVALSRVQKWLYEGWLSLNGAERIKRQVNTFVYDDNGKPGPAKGQHSDFIMGIAMACMATDRISYMKNEATHSRRPNSIEEMLQWEMATGRIYKGSEESFGDDHDPMKRALAEGFENITEILGAR